MSWTRPAGVYTAGVAQAYINLYNTMVGREIVILGSGDIGMIMARRLTLEGAHVKAVFEIMPYPSGLPRNVEQCLNDYHIPLYLSHTVTRVKGNSRVEGVTVSQVDAGLHPIPGTERDYACDTLILSVGLIPENELSREAGVSLDRRTRGAVVNENYQTDVPGIFSAGNVLHVLDLGDSVSGEAENLARSVADYIRKGNLAPCLIRIGTDENIGHTVPQRISGQKDFTLSLRVRRPLQNCRITVTQNRRTIRALNLKKAVPAQMIQLRIESGKIGAAGDLKVAVE